jgi:hypothetical protein
MLTPETSPPSSCATAVAMSPLLATDLQDHLMVAHNDLERLQRLLTDACESLMLHYQAADQVLKQWVADPPPSTGGPAQSGHDEHDNPARTVLKHLAGGVTALQFQDLAYQLVDHTQRRLRNCADRLARDTLADDEDGAAVVTAAPERPNPVTQDEMDAGSVELF